MADSKVSALSSVSSVVAAQEFLVNDAGTSKKASATQLAAFMSLNAGWRFLGQATASGAVRTGDVIWTGTYDQLMIQYFVAGYSGNAIARVILSNGAVSETATTFCTELIEGVTRTTTSVSVCGWPVAVTLNTSPRYGWLLVSNDAGVVKRAAGSGMTGGTAPTTVPTNLIANGMWNNTSTSADRARMTAFNAITGNTTANTMNSGTFINVWGRNND